MASCELHITWIARADECSQQAGAGSRGQEKAVAVMVVVAVVVVVVVVMVVVVDRLSNLYNKLSMSNFSVGQIV